MCVVCASGHEFLSLVSTVSVLVQQRVNYFRGPFYDHKVGKLLLVLCVPFTVRQLWAVYIHILLTTAFGVII
jgi:hypothetical protein